MKKFLAMFTMVAVLSSTIIGCGDGDKDKAAKPKDKAGAEKDKAPAPKEKDKM